MHDIRAIRQSPEEFDRAMARRGGPAVAQELLAIDKRKRETVARMQELQAQRRTRAREIGQARGRGEDIAALVATDASDDQALKSLEEEERALSDRLDEALAELPNLLDEDLPEGADEIANRELRRVGALPDFSFPPRTHDDIGEALGMMDFKSAAKLAGTRFVVLRGPLARLERSLAQFMLDLHTGEHGYTEIEPPLLVREEVLFGTGQLPKFADGLFRTTDGRWLIPTSEAPLTNLVAGDILDADSLPLRYTAYTPNFRSEAGAAGKDTRGMIRHHQFTKVELVSIVRPDQSGEEHERMTACAEEVLKRLGLPYRVVLLATGDTGFSARRTYDLEVWLPGQNAYREISSCSNCGAFQARRMKARFRSPGGKGTEFVHTLNGSGVAVGRALVAVVENFQQADGGIVIPPVLLPYMGGLERIAAPA